MVLLIFRGNLLAGQEPEFNFTVPQAIRYGMAHNTLIKSKLAAGTVS